MTDFSMHHTIVNQISQEIIERYPTRTVTYGEPVNEMTTVTFTPDFTGSDLTAVTNYIGARKAGIEPTLYNDIAAEIEIGRQFLNAANPTNAQAITAQKALWRVMRAVLRD